MVTMEERGAFDRLRTWARKRGLRLAAELLIVLAVILAAEWFMTRDAIRGPAPVFVGKTVSGQPFDLRQFRGRPAAVYFWATWCPVCTTMKGTIDSLAETHPVITVAMQSGDAEAVRRYLAEERVAFPAIADRHGKVASRYGVSGVPAVFVLDSRGEVAFVTRGYTTGVGLRARLYLADLL